MKRKPRPNGRFLSLRDAEHEFGLSFHLIYGWVREGRLPRLGEDVCGHAIMIRSADLEPLTPGNAMDATGRRRAVDEFVAEPLMIPLPVANAR